MTTGKHTPASAQPTLRGPLELQLDRVIPHAGPRRGKAFLMVSTGEAAGTVFPLGDAPVIVGRSPDADVRINELAISGEHARLEQTPAGFTIADLGSTNGTFVNGQRLVDAVALVSGDSIRMGSTTFTFVTREAGVPKGTVKLRYPNPELPIEPPRRARESVAVAPTPDSQTGSVSLTDVVEKVKLYWVYVRRYGRMAAFASLLGLALGIVHTWLRPPPGSAWFEMMLVSSGRPGDRDDEGPQVFAGPDSTFRSLPLIKRTLAELGRPNASDAVASDVQAALTFERVSAGSDVWRGGFEAPSSERATEFLSKHLAVYVDSELDKLLRVLRSAVEFDRDQEQRMSERVAQARARLITFSDEHPEAVPRDAKLPDDARVHLAPGASAEKIAQSIASTQRALRTAYTNIQAKKARPFLDQVIETEAKNPEARARGLGDRHPDVRSLLNLQASLRARANALLAAEPSPSEQALEPRVAELKQQLVDLEQRLAAARSASGSASSSPEGASPAGPLASVEAAAAPALASSQGPDPDAAASGAPAQRTAPGQSISQLRILYGELARDYERARTEEDALIQKREATERQLEREKTSAEARYEILTPPTPAKASLGRSLLKRGAVGCLFGLALALGAAACLELRRVLVARGHI